MLKTIRYWPQYKAEKHQFQSNEAVISITDPDDDNVTLNGAQHVLRLKFLDVENITCDMNKHLCYQDKHGGAILEFLHNLPGNVEQLIVHCRMGVSRSAAVALAIEAYTGATLENREAAFDANKLILERLAKTFSLKNDIIIPPINISSVIIYEL